MNIIITFQVYIVYAKKTIYIYRIIIFKAYLVKMQYIVTIRTCLFKEWNLVKQLDLNIKNKKKKCVKVSLTVFFPCLLLLLLFFCDSSWWY